MNGSLLRTLWRAVAAAVSVLLLTFATTVLRPSAVLGSELTVTMQHYAFGPSVLTINAGDTVTWTNLDQAPHDVTTTSAPESLKSPMLSKGQSWSHTFTAAGTYRYICSVHPDMVATLVVQAAHHVEPASQPTPAAAPSSPSSAAAPSLAAPAAAFSSSAPTPVQATTHTLTPATARATPQTRAHSAATTARQQPAHSTATATQQATAAPMPTLRPLLFVTGAIVAIAVFCLLLIASRPA